MGLPHFILAAVLILLISQATADQSSTSSGTSSSSSSSSQSESSDDDTYLDMLWAKATTYISNDFFPPTSAECIFDWGEGKCVRVVEGFGDCGCGNTFEGPGETLYKCSMDFKMMDLDPGRSCRLVKIDSHSFGEETTSFYDPTDCPPDEQIKADKWGRCPVEERHKTEYGRVIDVFEKAAAKAFTAGKKIGKKAICAIGKSTAEKEGGGAMREKAKKVLRIIIADVECV